MFIRRSTYDELKEKAENNESEFLYLQLQWNALVDKINAKGGMSFLNSDLSSFDFSKDELKDILVLCHPDKHKDSKRSTRTTQKVLTVLQEIRNVE